MVGFDNENQRRHDEAKREERVSKFDAILDGMPEFVEDAKAGFPKLRQRIEEMQTSDNPEEQAAAERLLQVVRSVLLKGTEARLKRVMGE